VRHGGYCLDSCLVVGIWIDQRSGLQTVFCLSDYAVLCVVGIVVVGRIGLCWDVLVGWM